MEAGRRIDRRGSRNERLCYVSKTRSQVKLAGKIFGFGAGTVGDVKYFVLSPNLEEVSVLRCFALTCT